MSKIQIRRGLKSELPTLNIGELGYCTDTKELFIGSATGNVLVNGGGSSVPRYNIKDSWSTSGVRTFSTYMYKFYINNLGNSDVTITINDISFVIKSKEEFEDTFDPFSQVTIVSSDTFYAVVSNLESGSVNPNYSIKDVFNGSSNVTHNFDGTMHDFVISNDGLNTLNFTINGLTIPVPSGKIVEHIFDSFNQVIVNTTTPFRAYARGALITDNITPIITASVNGGTFNTTQSVTLTGNETSTIYYTIDGSIPTVSSAVYSTPISISTTTTLKYFGKDLGGNSSTVQTQIYTLDTTAPTVSASPNGGTFTSVQSVTLTADETATIYYTTDGSTPTISSTVYSTPINVGTTSTLKFFGKDTAGNSSTIQTVSFTINLPDTTPPQAVTGLTSGVVTSTTIPVSWVLSASGDVANYEVAYSTDGTNFTPASSVINPSSTSYTITGLTASTAYTIKVVAIDGAGNRSTSNPTIQIGTASAEIILASDTFNRADTTITSDDFTTLGVTEVGGFTWTNQNSWWNYGIIGNQAYQQRSNSGGIRSRSPVTIPLNGEKNYAIELTFPILDSGVETAVHFRNGSSDLYYTIRSATGWNLTKFPNGGSITLVRYGNFIPASGDKLRIETYENGRIRQYVNGVIDFDIIDTLAATTSTKVGFATENFNSRFEDFKLIQLAPLPPDTTPPGEITPGTTTSNTSSIQLNWTNPNDGDYKGTDVYKNGVFHATVYPTSKLSNKTSSLSVPGLTASTSYTFLLKTFDYSGNYSVGATIVKSTI
jgi:hypothetical protein